MTSPLPYHNLVTRELAAREQWEPREYAMITHAKTPIWERGKVEAQDASGPIAPFTPKRTFDVWWSGLAGYDGILTVVREGLITHYYGHPRTYPPQRKTKRIEYAHGPLHIRITSTQALAHDTLPSYLSATHLTPAEVQRREGNDVWFGVVPHHCLWYAARIDHIDTFQQWQVRWYSVYIQPNSPKLRTRRFYAPVLTHPKWPALAAHTKLHILPTSGRSCSYSTIRQQTYELWRVLANYRYPLAPEQIMMTPISRYVTLQSKKCHRQRLQEAAAAWIGAPLFEAMQRYPITDMMVTNDSDEADTINELLTAFGSTQPYLYAALTGFLRTARWFAVGYGLVNERSLHVHEAKRWFIDAYSDGVLARHYWIKLAEQNSTT